MLSDKSSKLGSNMNGRADVEDDTRTTVRLLVVILAASVFLQRFGVPVGADGVSFNLLVNLVVVGILALRGCLYVDPVRTSLFLVFAAYALISASFNVDHGSIPSALLLAAMYLPFAFMLRPMEGLFEECLRAFRTIALICASCGIAQFFLQFVISSKLLYTFDGFFPAQILLKGFATYLPIAYGSPLTRSNGFFFLEPSVFSQFIAISIIIELLYFQVKWRLAVYGAALLFSYSGTGMIALILVPAILISRRSVKVILALALLGVLVYATAGLLHLNVFEQRAGEFVDTNTSGYGRFIAPAVLLSRYLFTDPHGLLFGNGPGSLHGYIIQMPFDTHDPVWAKLLFEYGIVGAIPFMILFILAVYVNSPSGWMSVALTIGFFTFGGELLDPRLNSLLLVFCVLPKTVVAAPFKTRSAFRSEEARFSVGTRTQVAPLSVPGRVNAGDI
jgi:hypothetical protein